jgi:hypothetical protein
MMIVGNSIIGITMMLVVTGVVGTVLNILVWS